MVGQLLRDLDGLVSLTGVVEYAEHVPEGIGGEQIPREGKKCLCGTDLKRCVCHVFFGFTISFLFSFYSLTNSHEIARHKYNLFLFIETFGKDIGSRLNGIIREAPMSFCS